MTFSSQLRVEPFYSFGVVDRFGRILMRPVHHGILCAYSPAEGIGTAFPTDCGDAPP